MNRISLDNENEYQVPALAGAFAICTMLVFLLLFITLSQSIPQPPPIEFIEVNFGTDQVGSGNIQTYNRASDSPNPVDVRPAENKVNRVTSTPRVERTPTPPRPKVEDARPSKTPVEKPDITSKVESPVSAPEIPEPKKTVSRTPAPTPAPVRTEPAPKPEPKIDQSSLFKKSGSASGSNGTTGSASGTGGNNNGDDARGVGDKGNPEGNIDAKSLYGKPGGAATGVALNVSGWGLGSRPQVNDDSDETGKIVFQIKVDDRGDILSVRTMETTVSAAVVEVYKRAVQRIRLIPKSSVTPPVSTGTLTFIIKSK